MNKPCLEDAHASEARTRTEELHDLPAMCTPCFCMELLFDIQWVNRWKQQVIEAMAHRLNYSEAQIRNYTEGELERAVTPENEPAATV